MASQARLEARDPKAPQESKGSQDRRAPLDPMGQMVGMVIPERLELMEYQ